MRVCVCAIFLYIYIYIWGVFNIYIYIYIYYLLYVIYKVKLATVVKGDPKAPFLVTTAPMYKGFLHFTLDTYLILLSVKQEGIKYHFLSLLYDTAWD